LLIRHRGPELGVAVGQGVPSTSANVP
jgi:hypothetical protein